MLVGGWIGSTNLGDELVFAGLCRLLAARGAEVAAISRDPAATRRLHGVGAVADTDLAGVWRAIGSADAMVFGGGGLLQDTTSPFNLPYHLSRPLLARMRGLPVAGIGLGAGALDTRLGRALVRGGLTSMVGVTVRDEPSRALLDALGVRGVRLASDLAFALGPSAATPLRQASPTAGAGTLAVCLRPWSGRRGRLPAQARGDATPDAHVEVLATGLDAIASVTGLQVRFVALQRDRDEPFHERVAGRMRTPSTRLAPALGEVLAELSGASAVVSMRFHGGVAAVLAGRPVVLIDYADKVAALAAELGEAGALLAWSPASLAGLPAALDRVVASPAGVVAARQRLLARTAVHDEVLDLLLGPVRDVSAAG